MSSEMIERVAVELMRKSLEGCEAEFIRACEPSLCRCRFFARTAMEALRLPVGASSVPGGMAIEESMFASEDTVFHGAAKCWNAMLEDALAAPPVGTE